MGSPSPMSARRLSLAASATTIAVVFALLSHVTPAAADTVPVTGQPATVSSDVLPAPQINGVVWDQEIVGNTVYVAGDFTSARPAGSAAGTNESARSYLLAYNLTSGALLPWAPVVNAQVRQLDASPNGSRLYAVGEFTAIDGVTKNRIAAFDTATGQLNTTFTTGANNRVYTVAATDSTVYFGGAFSSVSSVPRIGAAAVSAANGVPTGWQPSLEGGRAYAMVVSPDLSKVLIGGDFTTLNGSSDPGYGLGAVDAATGALLPWAGNTAVRNAGLNAAVYSLDSDGDSVYGTGYVFGSGGNLEGTFRSDWGSGAIAWVEDCHGDTYSVASAGDVVYAAGHPHYCGNVEDFPQTDPWTFHRALAFSKAATGTMTADPYGYKNWSGTPSPTTLNWYPDINAGTFTGQAQGPWSVDANANYVVYGGEFTTVNGKAQQGLVRFASKSIAPNLDGPRLTGDNLKPTLQSTGDGTMTVSWPANWDRDNEQLTYHVYRDGKTANPAHTTTRTSRFWDRPTISWVDTGLTPGQAYTYRIRAIDPMGNSGWGTTVAGTVATTATLSSYAKAVITDQPTSYWRLGDAQGAAAVDTVGRANATAGSGVSFGQPGAINGDTNTAAAFSGTNSGLVSSSARVWRDNTFTVETWVNTRSLLGGKIVGFGSSRTGNSGSYDRHLYLNAAGNVLFGVYPGAVRTLQSPQRINDGQWHHVVASLGAEGMQLYVDGARVGHDPTVTSGQNYWGYWRIGGDNTWSGSRYLAGSIDDTAIYPAALTQQRILDHYSRATSAANAAPVAAFTTTASGLTASFDGTGSTDTDGTIAGYDWDFGDGTPHGTGATATHTYATAGSYTATLVVTDNQGASTSVSKPVTVSRTNAAPTAAFTTSATGLTVDFDGAGSTDSDGTIAGYDWDFGDGTAHGTGATATHAYAAAGSYTATLLVTDNDGATASVSRSVEVSRVNGAPTASFTSTVNGLSVSVDAAGSTDDGSIAGYAWDFGDGATGTGVTATHAYAAAGDYTVSLTVTDDGGLTGTKTAVVTATTGTPPDTPAVIAEDRFERTTASGWGAATTGGPWTLSSAANANVSAGSGALTHAAGSTRKATLGTSATDVDVTTDLSFDKAMTGGGAYAGIVARQTASDYYQARVRFLVGGGLAVQILQGGSTVLANATVPGTYTPGTSLTLRTQITGASPTTISAKVWPTGTAEPAGWMVTTTSSATGLQSAGGVGVVSYVSASITNAPITARYDNFVARPPQ